MPPTIRDLCDDLICEILIWSVINHWGIPYLEDGVRPLVAIYPLVCQRWRRIVKEKCIRDGRQPRWAFGSWHINRVRVTPTVLRPFTLGWAQELSFTSCTSLGPEGCRLLSLQMARPGNRLKILALIHTEMTDECVEILAKGLLSPHCRMKRLYLDYNPGITDRSDSVLTRIVRESRILRPSRFGRGVDRMDFFGI